MTIKMPAFANEDKEEKMKYILNQLEEQNGKTLVLFNSEAELLDFKEY